MTLCAKIALEVLQRSQNNTHAFLIRKKCEAEKPRKQKKV
jgi:hypothetical protein